MSDPFRLDGKVAVVTGAGTGIGRACAIALADAGAQVVLAGRTRETLDAVAAEAGGTTIVADVCRIEQVEALFAAAASRTGRVDVVVNNAGVSGPVGNLAEVDLHAWRACIEVNLFGAMHVMRVAARVMTAQGRGSIVNLSSLMGLKGQPMRTAYCATKFALIGMTEAVAREVGPAGVRVNALCPGAISGELMDRVIARRAAAEGRDPADIIRESYTDVSALRRWVEPDEVARAALFLACDASSSITGEHVKVDAGRF